jgi:uncharacterized protein YjiS (DUF1127 family)
LRSPSKPSDNRAPGKNNHDPKARFLDASDSTDVIDMARRITAVAICSARGIFRKQGRDNFSQANIAREKSMPFIKHLSDRRSSFRARLPRRTDPRPLRRAHGGNDVAGIIALRPNRAPKRQKPATLSLLMLKAAALSSCAGNALPSLLFAISSWAIAEVIAGCAAYAQAAYVAPLPEPAQSLKARATDVHAPVVATRALPPLLSPRWVSLGALLAACWTVIRKARQRRQLVAELWKLDDRTMRDIGVSRCDIVHLKRHGAGRE